MPAARGRSPQEGAESWSACVDPLEKTETSGLEAVSVTREDDREITRSDDAVVVDIREVAARRAPRGDHVDDVVDIHPTVAIDVARALALIGNV
ncbi:MAG: hypothetical protein ACK559_20210, partial [bacterium]